MLDQLETDIQLPLYASPSMNQRRRHQSALVGLERYANDGWRIDIRGGLPLHATAERMHNGSLQFVQECGVYLLDVIERIAAAMDRESEA